ncbi:MAG TPA: Fic family protein, partial [Anaeromyxobacteraceae bacterium]|nr:Fic family protein [Anaeromyxobacteraceae bacterium]
MTRRRKPAFLTLDEVLALHADQIGRYGGSPGLRDLGLLESALAAPRATFGGEHLHGSLPEMAAAYLFHLVRNHPFVDGNK